MKIKFPAHNYEFKNNIQTLEWHIWKIHSYISSKGYDATLYISGCTWSFIKFRVGFGRITIG